MLKKFYKIFILSLLLILCGCDKRSEQEKLAHQAMQRTIKTLEDRYGLKYGGMEEGGESGRYTAIGLRFQIFRILGKEEGRKILINSVEELLKEINGDPNLKPFLEPTVFTPLNVSMVIFSYQPDGKNAFYPDIYIFSAQNGYVKYETKIPEQKYGYYTDEREPYEEALKLTKGI